MRCAVIILLAWGAYLHIFQSTEPVKVLEYPTVLPIPVELQVRLVWSVSQVIITHKVVVTNALDAYFAHKPSYVRHLAKVDTINLTLPAFSLRASFISVDLSYWCSP